LFLVCLDDEYCGWSGHVELPPHESEGSCPDCDSATVFYTDAYYLDRIRPPAHAVGWDDDDSDWEDPVVD